MQEAAARIRAAIDGAFDGDAHPFLIAVYKDPEMPHPTGRSEGGYWLREATPECERAQSQEQRSINCRVAEGHRWKRTNPVRPFNGTLGNWRWRLDNLYWITGKEGKRTKFRLNWAQETLFNEMHHLNVILKARQLGFTTFIQLFMLDRQSPAISGD